MLLEHCLDFLEHGGVDERFVFAVVDVGFCA